MKSNSRKELLSYLKGLASGSRSLCELINKEEVIFITYSSEPDKFFKVKRASESLNLSDDYNRESKENTFSKEFVNELKKNSRYKVQVITITYENETTREEGDSTFP